MSEKKQKQLGMNPSTASGRLVKDLLWSLIKTTNQDSCCKCGFPMSRETFSIEHVTPWLDSDDPVGLYFDLENISYSHLLCNIRDSRTRPPAQCGTVQMYNKYGCRCELCKAARSEERTKYYTKEGRQAQYKRTGK